MMYVGGGTYLRVIRHASLEHAGGVACGHVPLAPHDVVDVLAIRCGIGARLARTEAELRVRHEVLRK